MEELKKVSGPSQKYRSVIFQGYIFAAIISFTILAVGARFIPVFPFDLYLTQLFQLKDIPLLLKFMEFISFFGQEPQQLIIVVAAIIALFLFKMKLESLFMTVNVVGVYLLGSLTKTLIRHQRPPSDLVRVVTTLHDYGFPSGHVLAYTAFFGFLIFIVYSLLKKSFTRTVVLSVLLGFIFLVGPSRVYLGEHWTSDVVGGYLLGSLWLITIVKLYRRAKDKRIEAKADNTPGKRA